MSIIDNVGTGIRVWGVIIFAIAIGGFIWSLFHTAPDHDDPGLVPQPFSQTGSGAAASDSRGPFVAPPSEDVVGVQAPASASAIVCEEPPSVAPGDVRP